MSPYNGCYNYDCREPEDYVDECFTIVVYKKAYTPIIYPMPSEE
jgi:hypothetical protein